MSTKEPGAGRKQLAGAARQSTKQRRGVLEDMVLSLRAIKGRASYLAQVAPGACIRTCMALHRACTAAAPASGASTGRRTASSWAELNRICSRRRCRDGCASHVLLPSPSFRTQGPHSPKFP